MSMKYVKKEELKKGFVLKGSYTVEASFLLPMILSVIVVLIYLSFYIHDRSVLSSAAYQASLRGSQLISGENVMETVTQSAHQLIQNRLLGTSEVAADIQCDGSLIKVSYNGKLNIPAGALLCRYMTGGKNYIEVNAHSEAKTMDAVGFVRKIRIVEAFGR